MVKTSVAEFMQNHPPRKNVSILEPLRAEIIELKNAGYSVPQIIEFLAINDISVSKTALISFLKIRMRSTSLTPDENDESAVKVVDEAMTVGDRRKSVVDKAKRSEERRVGKERRSQ